jgi:hypothetical protein
MCEMTPEEQLKQWLNGESIHNTDRDECCPDFSCCRPEFMAPKEERERFAKASLEGDERTTNAMLCEFLSRAMRIEFGDKVYVSKPREVED